MKGKRVRVSRKALLDVAEQLFEQNFISYDPTTKAYFLGDRELLLSNRAYEALDLVKNQFEFVETNDV